MLRCSTNRPQAIGNSPSHSSETTTPQSTNSLPPCPKVSQDSSQRSSSHPLGHSGQAPRAAPPANAHPHFGMGTAHSMPTVCPKHTRLNGDSVSAPQSRLRAPPHPTVHSAPGQGLSWHLGSCSHPPCKQPALQPAGPHILSILALYRERQ